MNNEYQEIDKRKIDDFKDQGRYPGRFIESLLLNDLLSTLDLRNGRTIDDIKNVLMYIHIYVPLAARGTQENILAWMHYINS